ncbi:hypothetical protein Tsubulata_042204 [Turnera subulata]|uniref:DUF4378 domain-containing protein n=1 Tax=Turnera subulata TaxID=218843 RepID=A0A9Q0JA97_9ROSI|nr:hypothetical protein Tsubulata_042204 [Turnera subulata]
MGSSNDSCSSTNHKQRKNFAVERRPQMLKDFLVDNEPNSCSSNGFRSFPRKPFNSSVRTLISIDLDDARNTTNSSNNNSSKLLRSRSKAAASTAISAFHALLNAVKSPSTILPRSLSRKLSKRSPGKKCEDDKENIEVRKVTVTVKDIMRWKSFRDLVAEEEEEEKSAAAAELAFSPPHCATTATTTTWSNTTTPRSSNGSSWCDSDFTSEYLPFWSGNSEEYGEKELQLAVDKKCLPCVGEDAMDGTSETRTYLEEGQKEEDNEQNSPTFVMDFEFEEDEESSSSFDQSLATVERTTRELMQKIRRFENLAKLDPVNLEKWMDESMSSGEAGNDDDNVEEEEEEGECQIKEKAWQLLNYVKTTCSMEGCKDDKNVDQLLVDFFSDELASRMYQSTTSDEFDKIMVSKAEAWLDGEDNLVIRWEEQCKREAYVVEMDRGGKWAKLGEENDKVGLEIGDALLGLVLDDLLLELTLC